MAAFYGSIQGNRGEATRLGHSCMNTRAASWQGAVRVHLSKNSEGDVIADVCLTSHHGHGNFLPIYHGPVAGPNLAANIPDRMGSVADSHLETAQKLAKGAALESIIAARTALRMVRWQTND